MPDDMNNEEILREIEEQVFSEFAAGRTPAIKAYVLRYPQLERDITELFWTALAARSVSGDPSSEEVARVAALAEISRSRAVELTDRMREMNMSPKEVAGALNVPSEAMLLLQKRGLTELPELLVIRLIRVLKQPKSRITALTQAVESRPRLASHYRAEGTPQAKALPLRSFMEVMRDLDAKGKLTGSQRTEWLGDED